mgnify:CR=1 FL=1
MRFRMARINIDQFAILTDIVPNGSLEVNVTLSLKYSMDVRRIATSMSFVFGEESERILMLELTCEFEIHEEDWLAAIDGSKLVIPKVMLEHFAVQTVGTARGILHCKTEGSQFNGIILPPVNVTELVTEDMILPIE